MKRIFLITTVVLAFSAAGASVAFADTVADQVVTQLQAQGFTRFEVRQGPSQVRVEAIRGTEKVEYVYDLVTGQLLSQEMEAVRPGEDTTPGIEVDTDDDDFVRDDDSDDDSDDLEDERDEAEDREDDERDEAEDREDDERDEAEDRENDERDEARDREDDERDEAKDREDD